MTSEIAFLADGIVDYLVDHSTPADPVERRLIEETSALRWSMMQIGVPQARFMALLARVLQPATVVEVGTFTGYSSLVVARELGPDARLIACDLSEEWTAIGRRHWAEAGVDDRIDLRLGPAADTLRALPAGLTVDLAFIDADKTGYAEYLDLLEPHLGPRSVVLVDNVLWDGRILDRDDTTDDTVALRAFNDRVVADPRFDVALLPVGDGLSFITRSR